MGPWFESLNRDVDEDSRLYPKNNKTHFFNIMETKKSKKKEKENIEFTIDANVTELVTFTKNNRLY